MEFTPNLNTKRRKQKKVIEEPENVQAGKSKVGRGKGRVKSEPVVTASGPFALGPSERGIKSNITHHSSTVIVCHEKEEFMNTVSESEEEEPQTEWAPQKPNDLNQQAQPTPSELVEKENSLLFFQFPTILPLIDQVEPATNETLDLIDSQNTVKLQKQVFNELPSGKVGEYILYESGRLVIKFGDIELDVMRN
jgi:hypothetical protein